MTGNAVPMNETNLDRTRRFGAGLPMAALLLGSTILAGLPQVALAQFAEA